MSLIDNARLKLRNTWRNLSPNRIVRLERDSHGGRATYMGNNRVLIKCVVEDNLIALLLEADDLLMTPWFVVSGKFEIDVTRFFVSNLKKDSLCIDAGANFGYFSCLMARMCPDGRVIGIEPTRHVYELVRDNLSINGFHHARAIHGAIAGHEGEITLHRRQGRSGNTSIAPPSREFTDLLGELPAESFNVRTMRLDDVVKEFGGKLDFLKIDVEGSEPLVFAGAKQVINDNPGLTIVMEWSPGQIASAGFGVSDFLDDLKGLGLKPYDLFKGLRRITYTELESLPYRAGIMFRR